MSGGAVQVVRVALAERSYPIHIGSNLLGDAGLYAPHVKAGRVAVVSNEVVAPLYLDQVR